MNQAHVNSRSLNQAITPKLAAKVKHVPKKGIPLGGIFTLNVNIIMADLLPFIVYKFNIIYESPHHTLAVSGKSKSLCFYRVSEP